MPRNVRRSPRVPVLVLAPLFVSCAAASRRLPPRVIDDPITLPKRMTELSASVRGTRSNYKGERDWRLWPDASYGATDRVTISPFEGVTVAVLDDAPPEHASTRGRATPAPFGLALTAGIVGMGSTSDEWLLVQSVLGSNLRKRLTDRVRIGAGLSLTTVIGENLRQSLYHVGAHVLVQATRSVAFSCAVYDEWSFRALTPSSRWFWHDFGLVPAVRHRPWHWLTIGLYGNVMFTRRPAVAVPLTPETPARRGPADDPPPSLWAGVWTAFHW